MKRLLKLKVLAGARENQLVVRSADSFLISAKEPAETGRANRAALGLLGRYLSIAPERLWIVKGAHSPAKIIEVR